MKLVKDDTTIPKPSGIKSYISLQSERGVIINIIVAEEEQVSHKSRKITAIASEIINDGLGESFLESFFKKEKEVGNHNIRILSEFGDDTRLFEICIDELNYDEFNIMLDAGFLESMSSMLLGSVRGIEGLITQWNEVSNDKKDK